MGHPMRCFCLVTAIAAVCQGQGFEVASIRVSDNSQEKRSVSIVVKAAGPAKADEMRMMMQALLAERFKLKEADEADGPGINPIPGKMALAGKGTSLAEFAAFISDPLRAPVIDMTGLK